MKEEGGPSNWRDDRRNKNPRYDGRDTIELVAAGFNNPHEGSYRDDNRQFSQSQYSRGQDNYRQEGGQKREWKPRRTPTPEEELDMPCRITCSGTLKQGRGCQSPIERLPKSTQDI